MINKTAIIILNYNGAQDTIECVKSISCIECPNDIIVVDNASQYDCYKQLKHDLPENVLLIQSGCNLGYAGGNNIGIRYAYDKEYSYICVLNNDTIVVEDFLSECIYELESNRNIAFIGPTIVNYSDGKVQSTGGDININKGFVDCKNGGKEYRREPKIVQSDYIGGACMVFRRDIIDEVGVIPESYFLFYEETEWCYKAMKQGYKNFCLNCTQIVHKGSMSIDKISGLNEYLMSRNRIAFLRRNCPNKVMAFLRYVSLCIKTLLFELFHGEKNFNIIRFYTHGWFKKVDYKKYPFIRIEE